MASERGLSGVQTHPVDGVIPPIVQREGMGVYLVVVRPSPDEGSEEQLNKLATQLGPRGFPKTAAY